MTVGTMNCEKIDGVLYMDGYDDCLVGHCLRYGEDNFALYSVNKLVSRHMADGMTREEAIEYIDFNQLGAFISDGMPGFILED